MLPHPVALLLHIVFVQNKSAVSRAEANLESRRSPCLSVKGYYRRMCSADTKPSKAPVFEVPLLFKLYV